MLSEDYANQVFNLTGPQSLSFYDLAARLSRESGRAVRYVAIPPEAVEQSLRQMGLGEWFPP